MMTPIIKKGHEAAIEPGYVAGIWIVKQYYETTETMHDGHEHEHDHVSMLFRGKVRVEIDGQRPSIFTAPTWFVVRANKKHKIVALEDETCIACIHAQKGGVIDPRTGKEMEEEVPEDNRP